MTRTAAPADVPAPPWARWGLSGPGLLVATAGLIMSMSPSLLSRTWLTQGFVMGICAAAGYTTGVLLDQLRRGLVALLALRVSIGRRQRHVLALAVPALVVVALAWTMVANIRSQAVTARKVGLSPLTPTEWLGAFVLTLALFVLQLGIARLWRAWFRRVRSRARRFASGTVAAIGAVVVVGLVTAVFTDLAVVNTAARVIGRAAAATDQTTPSGRSAPTTGLRSGGPGSAEPWDTLGYEGQRFVSGAPSAAAIAAGSGVTARDVLEPIRAYASVHHHGDDIGATAAAVVAELVRTGAFDRKVLAVFCTTGTGWVNEWSTQAIEYLAGGDSAIAAMQYSDLPSPVALLTDRAAPREAGKALFDAVYAEWSRRPAGSRPQLVVGGESLGVYGGTAAFSSVDDMLSRAQGGVWSGGPSFTPMISTLMAGRTEGSPQILPVIDSGRHVRFSSGPRGLESDFVGRAYAAWQAPRFVFVQHASDPIVWWNPTDLFDQPDWLRERPGADVNPGVRWYPVVTFWQLTSDMAVGLAPPAGHGHRYGAHDLLPAWEAVLQLTPTDRDRLVREMSRTVSTDE